MYIIWCIKKFKYYDILRLCYKPKEWVLKPSYLAVGFMGKQIKNKLYREFLDNGIIQLLNEEHINRALSNIEGKHKTEGRALLIALYYTGSRPNEILKLKGKDISKEGSYILVRVAGSKGGLPRTIYLQYKKPLVKELYKYGISMYPEAFLFYNYTNHYARTVKTSNGDKLRIETTDILRYHFRKWFKGMFDSDIVPYYLRHNRFSKLAEAGLNTKDLRMLKGSKTDNSVMPYLHLSSHSAKKIARKLE